jgi:hypothetical protein
MATSVGDESSGPSQAAGENAAPQDETAYVRQGKKKKKKKNCKRPFFADQKNRKN